MEKYKRWLWELYIDIFDMGVSYYDICKHGDILGKFYTYTFIFFKFVDRIFPHQKKIYELQLYKQQKIGPYQLGKKKNNSS
jgi:hypothetical protein